MFLVLIISISAYSSSVSLKRSSLLTKSSLSLIKNNNNEIFDPMSNELESMVDSSINPTTTSTSTSTVALVGGLGLGLITTLLPEIVNAADIPNVNAIPSALAAYGHYLGLVLVAACLTTERILIKPGMSQDDEIKVIIADTIYGVAGVLVLASGYFRLTAYGKGLDFYLHEPIFWVKMTLFAIMGSSSFFPTIKLVQRAIDLQNVKDGKKDASSIKPMSEKLANRIIKVVNGELLALGSIPLTATLMSRGVGYADWLPWQAGAAPGIFIYIYHQYYHLLNYLT